MLAGWAWRDLCKEQAGVLLGSPETMPSSQRGSDSRHSPEFLWGGKQASEGHERGLIHPHMCLTQACRAGNRRIWTLHVMLVSGY